jgi:phosphoribosylformimino-5-aminoimidazole carboxamide ribotide isomerase
VQVIPAVDVLEGRVVRLRRGDFAEVTTYGDDPVAAAGALVSEGAALVHVVDLGGARTGAGDTGLWERLGATGIPFQAAGGLRSAEAAAAVLGAGAARAVMGTAAVWDPDVLGRAVAAVGGERLVAAIDVRAGRALGAAWTDEGRNADEVISAAVAAGVGRLMVTAVARDGMLSGPDVGLLERVVASAGAPVIASGGVGSLEDLRLLATLGAEAAVVGRALYEGRFTLSAAVAAAAG